MVQKNRSKEIWLVPKRGSLHQTICLIESLINRNYDQTRWNEQKQNNLGNDLRKRGAVRAKRSPSNQSIRTLLASVPQYFGLLYIDSSTTPNTVKLTDSGKKLYDYHKNNIKNIGTLGDGQKSGELIETSPIILEQFEKLQITNPIILKDCENILVFPFRVVLRLLLELGYLDREELAYFVFSIRGEDEIPLVINNIKKFRKQNKVDRDTDIKLFRGTHIGNITLVKAPSALYFENLCHNTGIIEKVKVQIPNPGSSNKDKKSAIKIKAGNETYIKEILNNKYKGAEVYDFGNRLRLWIDYIGNPKRLIPPRDISLVNKSNGSIIMTVEQNGVMLTGDLVEKDVDLIAPMFLREDYDIVLMSPKDGNTLSRVTITPDFSVDSYDFSVTANVGKIESINDIATSIIKHSASKTFDSNYSSYLGIIENIIGTDLIHNKNLRGAYYEFLYYKLLDLLREEGIIDDVFWNGRIGQFGLPRPAPGGKTGTPDIVFMINNEFFILELTTIKPKSTQFSAEGSSVPDHIKLFSEDNSGSVVNGIFSAPAIHERNTSAMQAILDPLGINLKCVVDQDLVSLLISKDRNRIYNQLKRK
ncbi:AlwI family restriction endonuclease [Anaerobacillus arseniciselenatis]|uniref:AlwI family restriction endonuclease n=1 Tax=Anaerobacillus arseniciselenatis TaxID=85682 RepID=A0A1S2LA96_9BACI|nr:AlwI family type II restriction endonuclease [Anaerobacillus arseniciselenatis]OIJ09418.1 AlwI family restriction endonuclease [Anaerobacillus arseniciselenatis]